MCSGPTSAHHVSLDGDDPACRMADRLQNACCVDGAMIGIRSIRRPSLPASSVPRSASASEIMMAMATGSSRDRECGWVHQQEGGLYQPGRVSSAKRRRPSLRYFHSNFPQAPILSSFLIIFSTQGPSTKHAVVCLSCPGCRGGPGRSGTNCLCQRAC